MHGLKRGGRTRLDTCNFFILTGTGRWATVGMEEDYSVHLFLFFSNTGSGIF